MNYKTYCTDASAKLRVMHSLADKLDANIEALEAAPESLDLCTAIVSNINQLNGLAEQLEYRLLHHIEEEDVAVAYAIRLAKDGLVKRMWGVRQDLEVLMKRPVTSHKKISVRPGVATAHHRTHRLRTVLS